MRRQKIYDAVHGFIRFNEIEQMLIDSEPFQRLHHIHQLGIAFIVYPGATHTRFEHSLGTMELATRIFERITSKDFSLPDADYWLQIIRLAALCHDLGHLPFSHDAEKELLGSHGHEEWTLRVIRSSYLKPVWTKLQTHFPTRDIVSDVLKMAVGEKKLLEMGEHPLFSEVERVLSEVITGDFFGADRIDYLLRDAQCTGVSYGLFDYHQLIEMLCVLPFNEKLHLGIEENGIESCEALLLARHFMHRRVYQYSSVKAYKFHLARFMKSFFAEGNYLQSLERQSQNSRTLQNRPFEPFCHLAASSTSSSMSSAAEHGPHSRPWQTDSKSSIFQGAGVLQLPLESYLSLSDNEILTALRKAARDPQAPGHSDADSLLRREKRFKAISTKEGIVEEQLQKIQTHLKIPSEALFWGLTIPKAGTQVKGLSFLVQTRSGAIVPAGQCSQIFVPSGGMQWSYVAPEFEKDFRRQLESLG